MSLLHISTPKPKDVTQKVFDALALAIHEHRLAPATKLGEDEIGEIYNVSRTVVRAALQSLAHIQLVEIQRNKGAFVASPTPREAREVFAASFDVESSGTARIRLVGPKQKLIVSSRSITMPGDAVVEDLWLSF